MSPVVVGIVAAVSDGDDAAEGYWIGVIEPDQLAALRAFRRAPRDGDRGLMAEPSAASGLPPGMNLELARRVYAGPQGTIDVVPGPNMIGCVVSVSGTGQRMTSSTTTECVVRGAHGFVSRRTGGPLTVCGVLGAEVRALRIGTPDGRTKAVRVNADDGYWLTAEDAVSVVLTLIEGVD